MVPPRAPPPLAPPETEVGKPDSWPRWHAETGAAQGVRCGVRMSASYARLHTRLVGHRRWAQVAGSPLLSLYSAVREGDDPLATGSQRPAYAACRYIYIYRAAPRPNQIVLTAAAAAAVCGQQGVSVRVGRNRELSCRRQLARARHLCRAHVHPADAVTGDAQRCGR